MATKTKEEITKPKRAYTKSSNKQEETLSVQEVECNGFYGWDIWRFKRL